MKILILSFYYKPDLCAGSFRTTSLIKELKEFADLDIDILTTMPNRYSSYRVTALKDEIDGNVKIHRIAIPSNQNSILDQIKSFKTYYLHAKRKAKSEQYDLIYATSSRLFTAFLGARIAKNKRIPLYLDIRDIFVDTIKDVLSSNLARVIKPLIIAVEKYTFSSAIHINLVSKGFWSYFSERYPSINYSWYTNGIDDEFLNLPKHIAVEKEKDELKSILYAGNVGDGQGLHTIIPELAKFTEKEYKFNVIGDGGRKQKLTTLVKNCKNVNLLSPLNRKDLINNYLNADILFLHLNNYDALEKVLPSKIFEYAATGKPILAGVSGYAAKFIREKVKNAEVFPPGNHFAALRALKRLKIIQTDRTAFVNKYSRHKIMKQMSASIYNVCRYCNKRKKNQLF